MNMKKNENFLKWLEGRPEKKAFLFSSDSEYTYSDYLEYCDDMGETPAPDNSNTFYNWVADMQSDNFETDLDNCRNSSILANTKFLVTGKLGLWWGRPTILPEIISDFDEVVERISEDNIEAWYDTDCIYITASHHDGTNSFEVFIIKENADISALEDRIEKEKYDFNPRGAYDKRFFEKITDFLF